MDATTPLLGFYRHAMEPTLAGFSKCLPASYQRAIDRLQDCLQTVPTVGDLTKTNILAVGKYVLEHGGTSSVEANMRKRLSALSREAAKLGIQAPDDGTAVGQLYSTRFEPELLKGSSRTRQQRRRNFRRAVTLFDELFGRRALLLDISRENVARLQKQIADRGQTALAFEVAKCLRRIALFAAREGLVAHSDFFKVRRPQRNKTKAIIARYKRQPRYKRPPHDPEPGTLRNFALETFVPQRWISARPKTIEDLDTFFAALWEHFGRDITIEEQTNSLAASHFAWLKKRGCQPRTVNRHRSYWFAIWRFACESEVIDRAPFVRPLKTEQEEPDAWSPEEVARIMQAPASEEFRSRCRGMICGIDPTLWWQAILSVAFYTAIRRRSLLELRMEDVDLDAALIVVRGKSMKNRRGRRFRIGPDCVAVLRAIWEPKRDLLFPCTAGRLNHHFKWFLKIAKIPASTAHASQFHKMRRTTATLAAIHGGTRAACELLGHSSEQMTMRYLDTSKLPDSDVTTFLPMLLPQTPDEERRAGYAREN